MKEICCESARSRAFAFCFSIFDGIVATSELFTDVGEQLVEGVDGCGVVPIPEAGVGGKDDTARIL